MAQVAISCHFHLVIQKIKSVIWAWTISLGSATSACLLLKKKQKEMFYLKEIISEILV
jgi:hypothetical protein